MGLPKLWGKDKEGNRGFAFSHVKTIYYNWASKILLKTKLDEMDALIDAKIAKAMMSNQQVNDANKVPTSALAYLMSQNITKNANDISDINGNFKVINYEMPNTEITDDYIKNAILSTTSTGAYLIKIIQDNNVCAILQGHNVSENYRFYVAFSYYNIGYVNKIKTFKLRLEEWTIETYITNTDLGGAVFKTASGNIVYGMNGIYVGRFNNGPIEDDGTPFSSCIYLIGTGTNQTSIYAFAITQYLGGHLFFNRLNAANVMELEKWKKLIA